MIAAIVITILLSAALIGAWWHRRRKRPTISLLVPFQSDNGIRERNWQWLKEYWEYALPEAEIIVQDNDATPFCKTAAVNAAFRKAKGDVIVILDADCYMDADDIRECAEQIREAREDDEPLWFLPYRRFYRLTEIATTLLLGYDPEGEVPFEDPPESWEYINEPTHSSSHWYGALIQVMPREAFIAAGGMDENFAGWGGEDISFMHAVDTLYGRHRTLDAPVYHLWHPTIQGRWAFTRQWKGQARSEPNSVLAERYTRALGDRARMRALTNR